MAAQLNGATVLITGASSGIGRCFAQQLAGRAKALILVARRAERLEALKTELTAAHPALKVFVQPCDLSNLAAVEKLLQDIAPLGTVDVLINNAGTGYLSLFEAAEWERMQALMVLNVNSVSLLIRRLLPAIVAQRHGGILNVSSGFGFTYAPGMAAYAASKHFMTGLTHSLRAELSGTGVAVTQVCPGPVATEFEQVAGNFTGMGVPPFLEITPEHCARSGLRAFERGRAEVFPGLTMKVLNVVLAFTPRWVLRWFWVLPARALRNKQTALLKGGPPA